MGGPRAAEERLNAEGKMGQISLELEKEDQRVDGALLFAVVFQAWMDLCQNPGTNMARFTQLCRLFTDGTAVYRKSKLNLIGFVLLGNRRRTQSERASARR